MREQNISEQIAVNNTWKMSMAIWYTLHYGLGTIAVVLSVTVASKPFPVDAKSTLYNVLAWVLALVTGLVAFLHPEQRGDRYQRAWSILSVAITRFKADDSYTVNHVLDAYSQGEDIIHQTESKDKPNSLDRQKRPAAPRS